MLFCEVRSATDGCNPRQRARLGHVDLAKSRAKRNPRSLNGTCGASVHLAGPARRTWQRSTSTVVHRRQLRHRDLARLWPHGGKGGWALPRRPHPYIMHHRQEGREMKRCDERLLDSLSYRRASCYERTALLITTYEALSAVCPNGTELRWTSIKQTCCWPCRRRSGRARVMARIPDIRTYTPDKVSSSVDLNRFSRRPREAMAESSTCPSPSSHDHHHHARPGMKVSRHGSRAVC